MGDFGAGLGVVFDGYGRWLVPRVVDGGYRQPGAVDRKRYVKPGVSQMVNAVWLVLAARAARILAKDLDQAGELCGRDHILQRLWKLNIELLPRSTLNPAAGRIRVAVRKRDVGLDIVDGRAVAQIGPQHMDCLLYTSDAADEL